MNNYNLKYRVNNHYVFRIEYIQYIISIIINVIMLCYVPVSSLGEGRSRNRIKMVIVCVCQQ